MLKLKKVAVTGGLACGKSTVCGFLKEFGAYTVNADQIVHRLLVPHSLLGEKVLQQLGSDIITNGQFDRKAIAQKVFNNPALLQALEDLLHPAVRTEIHTLYQKVSKSSDALLFVVEIPLLFETGSEKDYDASIAVISDPALAGKRFREKHPHNQEEFEKRMTRQLTMSEKAAKADYIIYNNGSLEDLKQSTKEIFNTIVKQ